MTHFIESVLKKYNPQIHHRHSIRLKGYDYTQAGAYFITVVTQGRENLFGEIVDCEMRLNEYGEIVQNTWDDLPNHNDGIEFNAFVIMPNHIHGIVIIMGAGSVGAGSEPAPTTITTEPVPTAIPAPTKTKTIALSEIVRQLKTFSARRINEKRQMPGIPVWQRNYYEHIIRNDPEFERISHYITHNPAQWMLDDENPNRSRM